jgi:aminoglycoside phosphotransferase (APT) family kinase protein
MICLPLGDPLQDAVVILSRSPRAGKREGSCFSSTREVKATWAEDTVCAVPGFRSERLCCVCMQEKHLAGQQGAGAAVLSAKDQVRIMVLKRS